jgi:hypothetical protein
MPQKAKPRRTAQIRFCRGIFRRFFAEFHIFRRAIFPDIRRLSDSAFFLLYGASRLFFLEQALRSVLNRFEQTSIPEREHEPQSS